MNVIIVESPTKAKTLTKFLKGAYQVVATMGHIRDLPKSDLGVDVEHDFAPRYIIPRDKAKQVKELKTIAKKADTIILATDPDREGEAIAWHVAYLLSRPEKKTKKIPAVDASRDPKSFQRIAFHEITEHAIAEALKNPRSIDLKLVDAQQARRIMDRLVGYKLSPLLWQKLSKRWLSAGRVQSVAVRLIVEREREIERFTRAEFWTVEGIFDPSLTAQLISHDGVKYEEVLSFDLFDGKYTTGSTSIANEQQAKGIISDLKEPFTVTAVDKKEIRRSPAPPYTTSTLQQDAGRKLYLSAKKTMQLAQKLYEEGYITYHRTDSLNLSDNFLNESRAYIARTYGKEFVSVIARKYHTKSKVAQEAHEAIRPTRPQQPELERSGQENGLNRDHLRLYELIWKRAVASQAAEAVFDSTTVDVTASNAYVFEAQGSVIKFEGFLKITGRLPAQSDGIDDVIIPSVSVGQDIKLKKATPGQHFTTPPPRYTEVSLIKTLEEKDIGRPSTYAPIISTIQDRQYVAKEDLHAGRQGKKLVPTELGNSVTDFLVQYFPDILELPFTAKMEQELDAIANGDIAWVPVIREFYTPFEKDLNAAYEKAEKVKVAEEVLDEACPDCGNPLVIRMGRFGKFIACSTFPACKYTRQFSQKLDMKCPRCGGDILIKKTRRGKTFYGCSNYPKCNFAAWKKEDIK
jgi:DNA topoisomerase-1